MPGTGERDSSGRRCPRMNIRSSICRPITRCSTACSTWTTPPDPVDRVLGGQRWRDVGAWRRQCNGAHPGGAGSARPDHGADDPQHRFWRFLRARGRRSSVLLSDVRAGVRVRDQRAPLRDGALIAESHNIGVSFAHAAKQVLASAQATKSQDTAQRSPAWVTQAPNRRQYVHDRSLVLHVASPPNPYRSDLPAPDRWHELVG